MKGRRVHHDERAILFVGTTKGVFVYDGDFEREKWKRTGPYLPDQEIGSIAYDHRDGRTVYVASDGGGLHRTRDFGRTWQKVGRGLPSEHVTHVAIGHHSQPDSVWVGLRPAAVAASLDAGEGFTVSEGFSSIPSAAEWWGAAGEPEVVSIVPHPESPDLVHVAANVAGVFITEDGGRTWQPCTQGLPASYPQTHRHDEAHREVFRLVSNPARPERLYVIGRDGVHRTDDGGDSWQDVTQGLPTQLVRSIAVSESKPGTICVVPLSGDARSPQVGGDLVVYRSFDGGDAWDRLSEGLSSAADATIHREAMCMDTLDEEGFYLATSDGSVFVSVDEGNRWNQIASGLAPILSLEIITEQP